MSTFTEPKSVTWSTTVCRISDLARAHELEVPAFVMNAVQIPADPRAMSTEVIDMIVDANPKHPQLSRFYRQARRSER